MPEQVIHADHVCALQPCLQGSATAVRDDEQAAVFDQVRNLSVELVLRSASRCVMVSLYSTFFSEALLGCRYCDTL